MQRKIQAAPTIFYPESDGKPMAETDVHRKLMMDFILILEDYFENNDDVYVSGNLLIYYERGNPRKSISPDVFVAFGVEKKQRNTYLTWAEAQTPDFVLEVASPSTFSKDMGEKKDTLCVCACGEGILHLRPDGADCAEFCRIPAH